MIFPRDIGRKSDCQSHSRGYNMDKKHIILIYLLAQKKSRFCLTWWEAQEFVRSQWIFLIAMEFLCFDKYNVFSRKKEKKTKKKYHNLALWPHWWPKAILTRYFSMKPLLIESEQWPSHLGFSLFLLFFVCDKIPTSCALKSRHNFSIK